MMYWTPSISITSPFRSWAYWSSVITRIFLLPILAAACSAFSVAASHPGITWVLILSFISPNSYTASCCAFVAALAAELAAVAALFALEAAAKAGAANVETAT